MLGDDLQITVAHLRGTEVWLHIRRKNAAGEFVTVSTERLELYEALTLAEGVWVAPVEFKADRVYLGLTAPKSLSIHRKETYDAIQRGKQGER